MNEAQAINKVPVPLIWSEPLPLETKGCRSDHVMAESPLGWYFVRWNSADSDSVKYLYLDADYLGPHDTLAEAKTAAAVHFRESAAYLISACYAPGDQPTHIVTPNEMVPVAGGEVEVVDEDTLRDLASSACQEALSFGVNEEAFSGLARTVELRARKVVTRLQAEVERLKTERADAEETWTKRFELICEGAIRPIVLERNALQAELTKAREVIGALAKGFNTLEQEGGKYRINMNFSSRDDAWSAYRLLSEFNAAANRSAPAAKGDKP